MTLLKHRPWLWDAQNCNRISCVCDYEEEYFSKIIQILSFGTESKLALSFLSHSKLYNLTPSFPFQSPDLWNWPSSFYNIGVLCPSAESSWENPTDLWLLAVVTFHKMCKCPVYNLHVHDYVYEYMIIKYPLYIASYCVFFP